MGKPFFTVKIVKSFGNVDKMEAKWGIVVTNGGKMEEKWGMVEEKWGNCKGVWGIIFFIHMSDIALMGKTLQNAMFIIINLETTLS